MEAAELRMLPTGRVLAVDDQGMGLRATWHLDRGMVNLTLWRGDRCVESFHLTIEDAARLTGFLVDGFAEVTRQAVTPMTVLAPPNVPAHERIRRRVGAALERMVHAVRR